MFHVSGGSSAQNLEVASFCERVQKQIVQTVRAPVPRFSTVPVWIELRPDSDPQAGLVRQQTYSSYALHQRLKTPPPEEMDQEEFLEGVTWALLTRYAVLRLPESERRRHLPVIPQWLSTGLGQWMMPESRMRNLRWIEKEANSASLPFPEEIVGWIRLPYQGLRERVACGLFTEWLFRKGEGTAGRILDDLAREAALDGVWLRNQTGCFGSREVAAAWDLWLAARARNPRGSAPLEKEDWVRLDRWVSFQDSTSVLFVPIEYIEGLSLDVILQHLPDPWARETLRLQQRLIVKAVAGKAGSIRAWADQYGDFLSRAASSSSAERSGLHDEWMHLEGERAKAMRAWLQRDQYLKGFESGNH